jgi:hypothetical protein
VSSIHQLLLYGMFLLFFMSKPNLSPTPKEGALCCAYLLSHIPGIEYLAPSSGEAVLKTIGRRGLLPKENFCLAVEVLQKSNCVSNPPCFELRIVDIIFYFSN